MATIKQKLDHLVLQLQSETETIGEWQLLESLFSDFTWFNMIPRWIRQSLYQMQRGLLSRRAEQLTAERVWVNTTLKADVKGMRDEVKKISAASE